MKKEIKFRAWVNAYGTLEMVNDYCFLDIKENHFFGTDLTNERPDIAEIIEVMQFTGCCDRNGKPIYEGDILKLYFGQIVEVRFIEGCFQYYFNEKSHKPFDKIENMNLSVIGNIYENRDLLS